MRSSILFLISLPILFSCSPQEELTDSSGKPEEIPAGISRVSFSTRGSQSPCVYVFRKEGDNFVYQSTLDSGWTPEGKLTTRLLIGDYKFLFTGPLDGQLDVLPAPLNKSVTFDQLRFAAHEDSGPNGDFLPAGELFLPEPDIANQVYTIRGSEQIACTLKRRVAQLSFTVARGYKKEGTEDEYVPQPYTGTHNILETIKELRVEIAGVANQCNYLGTSGKGKVYQSYTGTSPKNMTPEGFVTFTGPFVFPPADGEEVKLTLTLVSVTGEEYTPISLKGKLEANRQLAVNLWLAFTYFDIGVTVHTEDISGRTGGDAGMWE